jgi:hypothetical protein
VLPAIAIFQSPVSRTRKRTHCLLPPLDHPERGNAYCSAMS